MNGKERKGLLSDAFASLGLIMISRICWNSLLVFMVGLMSVASTSLLWAQRARLEFKKTVHDFGTLQQGEKVSHVFEFVNAGDAPLQIFQTWGD